MSRPPAVQIGQRFSRLVVESEMVQRAHNGTRKYICRCDCGERTPVTGTNLRQGHTRSCGCLARETARERGLARPRARPRH